MSAIKSEEVKGKVNNKLDKLKKLRRRNEVNKITNKGVVNKELVNRANEVSTKGTTIRGNRETTIMQVITFQIIIPLL